VASKPEKDAAQSGGLLPTEVFRIVVDSTPLVSIDLILRNGDGEVLLGLRNNRPAAGSWFVPGGRIRKGETIPAAFRRVCRDELGVALRWETARCAGVFTHFYEKDNPFSDPGIDTHYVVIGLKVEAQDLPSKDRLPRGQHGEFRWWGVPDLLRDPAVHPNTKAYFTGQGRPFPGPGLSSD